MYVPKIEYRLTIDLLQHKIINYLRLNVQLNKNIRSKPRFVEATVGSINFNFSEFSEAYQAKHISGRFQEYCKGFVEFLKPLFLDFVKEIRYSGCPFILKFILIHEKFERSFVIQIDEI